MKEEQHQFLTLVGQAPARLTVEQVAWLLGCQPHDVPILVSTRLLKPLGNPPQNGTKYFCRSEIMELSKDRAWLAKMTQTISQHWPRRNVRQNGRGRGCADDGLSRVFEPIQDAPKSAPLVA